MAKQQARRPAPTPPKQQAAQQARKSAPAPARRSEKKESIFGAGSRELIYGPAQFRIMGIGLALVIVGLILMAGGRQPDPNTWNADDIYSFRRITLAPIVMVAGFVVVVLGIFKKNPSSEGFTPAAETETPAE
jgi:uncharacterized membrane protein